MSSKGNKRARKALERIYGKGCFIERGKIVEKAEKRGITGYKVFIQKRKFTRMDGKITYHHIKERCKGGQATVENGANVKYENHEWIHSLNEEDKNVVNELLQEFKINFVEMHGGEIVNHGTFDIDDLGEEVMTLQLHDQTLEINRDKAIEERKQREKRNRLKNPTRAMKKQELRQILEESELEEDDFYDL